MRLFFLTSDRDQNRACREHGELFDAIRSGPPRMAESPAHLHVERGRVPALRALRS